MSIAARRAGAWIGVAGPLAAAPTREGESWNGTKIATERSKVILLVHKAAVPRAQAGPQMTTGISRSVLAW